MLGALLKVEGFAMGAIFIYYSLSGKKLLKSTSNEIFVPLKEYAARYWLEEKVGKRQLTQFKGGYNSSPKVLSLLIPAKSVATCVQYIIALETTILHQHPIKQFFSYANTLL